MSKDDRIEALRALMAEGRFWIDPSVYNREYIRARADQRVRKVVGIFCCACKKKYPPREPSFDYTDICSCGHEMGYPGSLCPTCGVVTEFV